MLDTSSMALPGFFTVTHALIIAVVSWMLVKDYDRRKKAPKVASAGFPVIDLPIIGSWIAAIRFLRDPVKVLDEGIAKSKNGLVRIATHQGEYILVTERTKVSEYLRVSDNILNSQEGANDQQQIPFTMGYGVGHRTYHTSVVKGPVTKTIPQKTSVMVEEAAETFDELIGIPSDFTPITLYSVISMTVARMANRIYVGKEFCYNKAYLQDSINYAEAVVISAEILRMFPNWFKEILVKFLPCTSYRKRAEKVLEGMIRERLDGKRDEHGEKYEDLVQWLIDEAPPIEKTVPQLSERVMALNVASIHTTTMTFTSAFYVLASDPDKYVHELRQEVLDNLEDGKITSNTLSKLPKMESFFREGARCCNTGLMAMQRNARAEFKFSDGTVIPAGAKLGSPTKILHFDPEVYPHPEVFDGFRYYKEAAASGETQKTIVTPGASFHVFGAGRHPCPGRFLATQEMKLMLALLLLRYDFKLPPGARPRELYIATMAIPDNKLPVLFKSRR